MPLWALEASQRICVRVVNASTGDHGRPDKMIIVEEGLTKFDCREDLWCLPRIVPSLDATVRQGLTIFSAVGNDCGWVRETINL
jgi:hypothetical protein